MPYVRGFLKVGRRPKPGQPLPGEPDVTDPDYGLEEGERPEVEPPELPDPPPGIWPPPTPGHPIQPLPPSINVPPGAIWPRPPGPIEGKFIAIVHIPDHGWHYVVIDPDAWTPEHLPEMPGTPQPKRP